MTIFIHFLFGVLKEIENEFRVSRRDLVSMELAVLVGLEFFIGASNHETQPHFRYLHKCLGLVSSILPQQQLPYSPDVYGVGSQVTSANQPRLSSST